MSTASSDEGSGSSTWLATLGLDAEASKRLVVGFAAFLCLAALIIAATSFIRRRKMLPAAKVELSRQATKIRKSYNSTAQNFIDKPRSNSWRTPPQSRDDFLGGATSLIQATCRNGAPSFDPMRMDFILKNYTNSLPCYKSRLESIEDEGSRSEDDEASSRPEGPAKVSLRIAYNGDVLLVRVLNCKGLPPHCLWTPRGPQYFRRNSYVHLSLVPESDSHPECFETKPRSRTLNPKFDEAFEFTIGPEDLHDKALKVVVLDREEGKGAKVVGTVLQPLDTISAEREQDLVLDLSRSEQSVKEEPGCLQRRSFSPGDIFVGLTCNPLTNRIRINVLKMKGFSTPRDVRLLSGAYVRIQLYHGHHLLKTKNTSVLRIPRHSDEEVSIFESFNFGIPGKFFDSCSLSLTVVAAIIPKESASTRDLILGNSVLGPYMFARGDSLTHWEDMMKYPGAMISKWHQLEDPSRFRAKGFMNRGRSRSLGY